MDENDPVSQTFKSLCLSLLTDKYLRIKRAVAFRYVNKPFLNDRLGMGSLGDFGSEFH